MLICIEQFSDVLRCVSCYEMYWLLQKDFLSLSSLSLFLSLWWVSSSSGGSEDVNKPS